VIVFVSDLVLGLAIGFTAGTLSAFSVLGWIATRQPSSRARGRRLRAWRRLDVPDRLPEDL